MEKEKINSVSDAIESIRTLDEWYYEGDSNCPLKNCPQWVIDDGKEATDYLYNIEEKAKMFDYLMQSVRRIDNEREVYYISFNNDTPWLNCIKIDKEHYELFKKITNKVAEEGQYEYVCFIKDGKYYSKILYNKAILDIVEISQDEYENMTKGQKVAYSVKGVE